MTGVRFRSYPTAIVAAAFALLSVVPAIEAGDTTWNGGGASNVWGDASNWGGTNVFTNYGTVIFNAGGGQGTTSVINGNLSQNRLLWTGSSSWNLNNSGGSVLSLFDNGGTQAKIENQSTGLVTINAPITFAATSGAAFGEINAVNGGITFGTGTLTVNGSIVNGVKLFGSNQTTTFNNTVSPSGKWFGLTGVNSTMAVGGSFTSGDIYVMNGGTLKLNSGGTVTTSALRLGGDFGNTGNGQNLGVNSSGNNTTGTGGTLQFTSLTGGQSFASVINTVSGNTSNALLIDSLNTSGTNTLAGASFLDADLKTQVAAGGTLTFNGGSIDVKIRKLTVGGGGTTVINEPLTSSSGAGGLLVKEGAGTLILQGTANNYTGTNAATLNANGTQLSGGTLGIYVDASLGLAPAGPYNNIQFLDNATLQDTANNITLNANRNISIASGKTANLDSNGNTFEINGIINGSSGAVSKSGGGTLRLTASNSYTGTTTVEAGTLQLTGSLSATSGVQVNGGGTLLLGGDNRVNNAASLGLGSGATPGTGGNFNTGGFNEGPAGGASGASAALGALTLSANSTIDFSTGATVNGSNLLFSSFSYTAGTAVRILNWTGAIGADSGAAANDRLLFIANPGLTDAQLASIQFFNDSNALIGSGATTISFNGYTELVPVPEPATIFGALGLLGLVGYRERRRLFGCGLSTGLDKASA